MELTPNFGFELLAPSQSQPEVPLNYDWNKLDTLLFDLAGTITVEEAGASPGHTTRKLIFGDGFTVTAETDNATRVDSTGGGSGSSAPGAVPVIIQLSCSDLLSELATGTSLGYVRAPVAFTLTEVRASLLVASSTGGPVSIDIKKNGVTVLSTALTIDDTETTSTTAATPPVISVSAIGDDDEISIDVTDAGTGAQGLIVTLKGSE